MIGVEGNKNKIISKSYRFESFELNLAVESDLKLFDEIVLHFY